MKTAIKPLLACLIALPAQAAPYTGVLGYLTYTHNATNTEVAMIELRFSTNAGLSYRIEDAPELGNWSILETDIIGTGGDLQRSYSLNGTARFFRIRRN